MLYIKVGNPKNLDANKVPVKIVDDQDAVQDKGYVIRSESRFTNKAYYLLGLPNGKTQYEFHIPPGMHKTIVA